jgi:hypothetical protein
MKMFSTSFLLVFSAFLTSVSSASDFAKSDMATTAMMENIGITNNTIPKVVSEDLQVQGAQDFVTVILQVDNLPLIRLFVKGPHGFLQDNNHSFRTFFMVTGFLTGAQSTSLLPLQPNTVYVAFDYPFDQKALADDLSKVLQTFRITPSEVALSLKWISTQSWQKPEQTVAVGVSLGGLFLPASLHIAMKMNVAPAHTVFAFTGGDLGSIIKNVLGSQLPSEVAEAAALVIPAINTLNDPPLHLPYLQGSFLVVRGDSDEIIPSSSTSKLYKLLPSPKKMVLLRGPHIDIGKQALIDKTGEAILDWLKNNP